MKKIADRFKETLEEYNISSNLEEIVNRLLVDVISWQQEVDEQMQRGLDNPD